jgi:hypothetical protein
MKGAGEKMGAMAICAVPVTCNCAFTSSSMREAARWSKRCSAQASRESPALTSWRPTMGIWACSNAVGCIDYETATSSQNSIPRCLTCSSGPEMSKHSLSELSPIHGLIRAYLWPNKRPHGASSSAPWSRNYGSCLRPTCTRPRPCIYCVSVSNASYRNWLSLSQSQEFRRAII